MNETDKKPGKTYHDGLVDSLASIAVLTIAVIVVVYWLSGSPAP